MTEKATEMDGVLRASLSALPTEQLQTLVEQYGLVVTPSGDASDDAIRDGMVDALFAHAMAVISGAGETPEEITIISHTGSRRVLVPALKEYRDIGSAGTRLAALVIDSRDAAYDFMKGWAERTPDVEIVGLKKARKVCPVCSESVRSDDELSEHFAEVHWDNGEEEETEAVRGETAKGRSEVVRKERAKRTGKD